MAILDSFPPVSALNQLAVLDVSLAIFVLGNYSEINPD